MILNIMSNIFWLAYAEKIHDHNLAAPNMVGKLEDVLNLGALVAIVLMAFYLNVYRRPDQIVLCLILMTISDLAF